MVSPDAIYVPPVYGPAGDSTPLTPTSNEGGDPLFVAPRLLRGVSECEAHSPSDHKKDGSGPLDQTVSGDVLNMKSSPLPSDSSVYQNGVTPPISRRPTEDSEQILHKVGRGYGRSLNNPLPQDPERPSVDNRASLFALDSVLSAASGKLTPSSSSGAIERRGSSSSSVESRRSEEKNLYPPQELLAPINPSIWFNTYMGRKCTQFMHGGLMISGTGLYYTGGLIMFMGAVQGLFAFWTTFSVTEVNRAQALQKLITGGFLYGVGLKLMNNKEPNADPFGLLAWGIKGFIDMIGMSSEKNAT